MPKNYYVDNAFFFLDKKKKIHTIVDKKKRPDFCPVLCLHPETSVNPEVSFLH